AIRIQTVLQRAAFAQEFRIRSYRKATSSSALPLRCVADQRSDPVAAADGYRGLVYNHREMGAKPFSDALRRCLQIAQIGRAVRARRRTHRDEHNLRARD